MLFSSHLFIFIFLPITILLFFIIGEKKPPIAIFWLGLASLLFYGFNSVLGIPLLMGSIIFNYLIGKKLLTAADPLRKRLLFFGVLSNITFLGFFKYSNFIVNSFNYISSSAIPELKLFVPIGISFFTFIQIAFLVDVYRRKITSVDPVQYHLFGCYFPTIVSGPIIHYRDVVTALENKGSFTKNSDNLATGITLFIFGLAKKVVIADQLSPLIDPAFSGLGPHCLQAWIGLFAYTLQLYFDFSGYSDMAIGVSRMFNIHLPANFNSPYKSLNVSEFWQRWHISLSQFLREYLYIPLGGNRHGQYRRYRNLMLTMLLGGLWHGANWTYVVWGGLHGLYLCIHQFYRYIIHSGNTTRLHLPAHFCKILTFLAVAVAWGVFRSQNMAMALDVFNGLIGKNGFLLSFEGQLNSYFLFVIGSVVAFFLPNTQEIILGEKEGVATILSWSPNCRWAILTALVFVFSMLNVDRSTNFIYVQF